MDGALCRCFEVEETGVGGLEERGFTHLAPRNADERPVWAVWVKRRSSPFSPAAVVSPAAARNDRPPASPNHPAAKFIDMLPRYTPRHKHPLFRPLSSILIERSACPSGVDVGVVMEDGPQILPFIHISVLARWGIGSLRDRSPFPPRYPASPWRTVAHGHT